MKIENKKTLKGSVLFTTVAVMSLLIIFLMGTLMLATASNHRAHKSYSTSQASYTARAAIDSFMTAMQRQPEVAAAVEHLSSTPGEKIYPEIRFVSQDGSGEDLSLGRIGYYDDHGNWVDNEIVVESTGETKYVFMPNPDNPSSTDLVQKQVEIVKISATARVGKEEETVAAYISKMPGKSENINPGDTKLKGLQLVGGANFPTGKNITGGLGVNLSSNKIEKIEFQNDTNIDTSLAFLNGDIVAKTSTFRINIEVPKSDNGTLSYPLSQTVVRGSLYVKNDNLVHVTSVGDTGNYEYMKTWTDKQIPYLYVNGVLGGPETTNNLIKYDGQAGAKGNAYLPFNLFVGTMYYPGGQLNLGGANVYMMDEADATKSYEFTRENDVRTVAVGHNLVGNTGTSLFRWSSSVVNKNEMSGEKSSGNIYCNGNLTLNKPNIQGDVRVKGDLTLIGDVNIEGKVVVGGTLYDAHMNNLNVTGGIYATNVSNSKVEWNGTANVLVPGPIIHVEQGGASISSEKVFNVRIDNEPVEGEEYRTVAIDDSFKVNYLAWDTSKMLIDGYKVNPYGEKYENQDEISGILYYDWADNFEYNAENKERVLKLNEAIAQSTVETANLNYNYILEDATNSLLKDMKTNNWLKIDSAQTAVDVQDDFYYGYPKNISPDLENPVLIPTNERVAEGVTELYYDVKSGTVLSKDETDTGSKLYYITYPEGDHMDTTTESPYTWWFNDANDYVTNEEEIPTYEVNVGGGGGINPLSSSGFTVNTIYPNNMTRESVYGKEEVTGNDLLMATLDRTKLVANLGESRKELGMDVATGEVLDTGEGNTDALRKAISNITKVYSDTTIDTITEDCILRGSITGTGPNKEIVIDTTSDLTTIVFDGANIRESNIIFRRASNAKKLNIIFTGSENRFFKSTIIPYTQGVGGWTAPDYSHIKYNDKWGITYYSYPVNGLTENTVDIISDNGCTLFGSFKAPYANLIANVRGLKSMSYEAENGQIYNNCYPTIVGNALLRSADVQNDFEILYTEAESAGAGGGGAASIKTAVGYFDVAYYGAS